MMSQFHNKWFIIRPVSAARPNSVINNLRVRCHNIPLKLSVTEDGLTAKNVNNKNATVELALNTHLKYIFNFSVQMKNVVEVIITKQTSRRVSQKFPNKYKII